MKLAMRQAKSEDRQQMLQVYNNFAKQFVGSAVRTLKQFTSMLRKKENFVWVALDGEKRIVGYVYARLEKRLNRGEFAEIVVDPSFDYVEVAKPLVEKVSLILAEKKVFALRASSIRNPYYDKLFPALGYFESESLDVFMYAVLDVQKFLYELSSVFINRLEQKQGWNGLMQVECAGHSLFLQKAKKDVQRVVWTNQPVDFRIKLDRTLLIKLVFGVADVLEAFKAGQFKVETRLGEVKARRLLKVLFPRVQFLVMDYW